MRENLQSIKISYNFTAKCDERGHLRGAAVFEELDTGSCHQLGRGLVMGLQIFQIKSNMTSVASNQIKFQPDLI